MSKEKRDSVPPPSGGPILDPYEQPLSPNKADELPLVKAVEYMKTRWIRFVVPPIFLILLVLLDHFGVIDWRVLGAFMLIVSILYTIYRVSGKQGLIGTLKKHPKKLILLVIFGPLIAPFALGYCGSVYTADYDRIIEPPEIIYGWSVNTKLFNKEDLKLLESQSLDGDEADKTCVSIRAAAKLFGIEADRCSRYSKTKLKKGQIITMVFFESRTIKKSIALQPAPEKNKKGKAEEPSPESQSKKVPILVAYFITAKVIEEKDKPDAGPVKPSETLYTVVVREVPDLQITLGFLIEGFGASTGKTVNLTGLEEILNRIEQKPAQPQLKTDPG